jgi:HD-GYP domain-containing protein (c-di-GMP phosphodiesterase class II)
VTNPVQKRTKILYTFMSVIVALVIVPLFIVVWQLISVNRESLRANERADQLRDILSVANQLETYVVGHRNQIIGIARALETTGGVEALLRQAPEARTQSLSRFLSGDPTADDPRAISSSLLLVGIVPKASSANLEVVAQWNNDKMNEAEVRGFITEAVAGLRRAGNATFTSAPTFIQSSNEFVIIFAEPLRAEAPTGEAVITVVSMEPAFGFVNQSSVGSNLDNQTMLKNGSRVVFLVSEQGRVLVHPDRAMVYGEKRDVNDWEIVAKWKRNITSTVAESFSLKLGDEELPMLGSFTTARIAPKVSLGVIAVVNENAAYSSVGVMIRQAATVSVFTVAVAVAVGTILAYWITSPIAALASGARAIASGDFSKRINVRTHSEIGQLAEDFNSMGDQVQRYIADLKFAANENRQLFLGTVRALAEAIDGKDPYTRGHSERVCQYSVLIAQYMGLDDDEVEDIRIAAILHDVGKIGIEDRILKKPAALTEEEFTIMKSHPQKGANIMAQIPQMKKYVPGMYYHHECIDGRGYPLGLKGEQIPMMARIISVADTFDAMTTNRPYQRAMTPDAAVTRIYAFSGTRYDPRVVDALDGALKAGKLDEVIVGYQEHLAAGKA